MAIFKRGVSHTSESEKASPQTELPMTESPSTTNNSEKKLSKHPSPENPTKRHILPTWTHEGRLHTKGIHPDGESGRSGIHPYHFLRVTWHSASPINTYINLLWPFVPAAIALHFIYPDGAHPAAVFAINYIAMVPPASMLGFAGQELARKLPKVAGIVIETTLGGTVEIVLFTVLIVRHSCERNLIPVVQAAIIGSIIANLLLCLGSCFLIGGLRWKEQQFHAIVSEVGSGLLLVAGFALLIPSAFYSALSSANVADDLVNEWPALLHTRTLKISRGTAIILIFAFFIYIIYSAFSHDSIFDEVLRADEEADNDREEDMAKSKYTLTEAIAAIVISLVFISLIAVFLVFEIEPIVQENGVPDNFLGLILVPLVEKIAEHLTAVDEAWDNQINFALYHCLGPSIQTALFNGPLVVIIGWGLKKDMDLNFEIFQIVLVLLSILVVGNFLRDGSSNYLEGSLLLIVYLIIALTSYFYPDAKDATTNGSIINLQCQNQNADAGAGAGAAELVARGLTALVR